MKTICSLFILLGCVGTSASAASFETIEFENPGDFKSLGVYDVWENSPFRTGQLKGNYAVVENPFIEEDSFTGEVLNSSDKVLGMQRSRFGSNRFGVRIDLNEPFELSPHYQYIHVMLHKPKEGRVMLVGLGSRKERQDQNPYAEQFWVLSENTIKTDSWNDAVFPIKGAEGIEIRSLVMIPDCESPHNLEEDFLCYIDNISLSESSVPRIINEFYPISGNKEEKEMRRKDRFTTAINLNSSVGPQKINVNQKENAKLYQNLTDKFFYAKPGDEVTPEIDYNQEWMHAYCYIDLNNDGNFETSLNSDGTPVTGGELLSYNYYNGLNSLGERVSNNLGAETGKLPSFKLPETLKPGTYRMRYKLDWDNIDPKGGSASTGNDIGANGGLIADVMLFVYDGNVTVNDYQLNGEIVAANGDKLNSYKVKSDQPFIIKSSPEKGFHNGGVKIKAGYNLENPENVDKYGNTQYFEIMIPAEEFNNKGLYTLPAELMRGNLMINGLMLEN